MIHRPCDRLNEVQCLGDENVQRDFGNNSIQKQDQLKATIMFRIRGGAQKTEEKQQQFHRQRLVLAEKNLKSIKLY